MSNLLKQYILDENKNPIEATREEWGMFRENPENLIVKQETIKGVKISTVFLGLDHNYWGGAPILFETMIFGGALDLEQERYCTWDEALRGHELWAARVKLEMCNGDHGAPCLGEQPREKDPWE